ncbi:hypothetical protein [Pseudonocardia sp. HH130630-07]|uniref:hypothetical protein n=1 Tax=Pseudonocardia sp. HH130630-07 TaxID=1690815 RepID=UPI0012E99ACB|nr:hypothetical protein [Pseudonocardia sp. HH130630-07]
MTAGQSADADVPDVFTLTSVLDNRAHKVIDSELCAPHACDIGRYEALCGHLVSPAPLVEEDGAPCARCAELDPTATVEQPRRSRRRGWGLRRMLTA